MPEVLEEQFLLPTPVIPTTVRLLYLDVYGGPRIQGGDPVLTFLHRVRLESLRKNYCDQLLELERQYQTHERELVSQFRIGLKAIVADVFAMAPSSRGDVLPYGLAVLADHTSTIDLSAGFRKPNSFRAGSSTTPEEVLNAVRYSGPRVSRNAASLLIVDDVTSFGRTAAAMLSRMWESGLSRKAAVTLASPLLVRKSSSSDPWTIRVPIAGDEP